MLNPSAATIKRRYFDFCGGKNRNAAKMFGSSSAQGCGGQERMMGVGEGGEKGPFLKRAFSPPQVTTFIGNRAFFNNHSSFLSTVLFRFAISRMFSGFVAEQNKAVNTSMNMEQH
jgi:hypothetical protein